MRDAGIALAVGLFLLELSHDATRDPWGASDGYPFKYSYPNLPCERPNPFNGCGYAYDPLLVSLNYLFWTMIASVFVFLTDLAWSWARPRFTKNGELYPGDSVN